jgi:hypothetical protein
MREGNEFAGAKVSSDIVEWLTKSFFSDVLIIRDSIGSNPRWTFWAQIRALESSLFLNSFHVLPYRCPWNHFKYIWLLMNGRNKLRDYYMMMSFRSLLPVCLINCSVFIKQDFSYKQYSSLLFLIGMGCQRCLEKSRNRIGLLCQVLFDRFRSLITYCISMPYNSTRDVFYCCRINPSHNSLSVSPGGYPVVEYQEQAVGLSLNIIIQISHFSKPGFNNKRLNWWFSTKYCSISLAGRELRSPVCIFPRPTFSPFRRSCKNLKEPASIVQTVLYSLLNRADNPEKKGRVECKQRRKFLFFIGLKPR